MRKMPFRIGTDLEFKPQEDPWQRRMPTQVYIGRDFPKRVVSAQPVTFGQRRAPSNAARRPRRFSLVRLAGSLFQGPRKTRRTKLR